VRRDFSYARVLLVDDMQTNLDVAAVRPITLYLWIT
jgi:hypothetical protein